MIDWNPDFVAKVLGTPGVFQDNSSYRFAFVTHDDSVVLTVFPYCGDVELSIQKAGSSATWRLHCVAIKCNDDIPEEGGQSLTFCPIHATECDELSHWVVLSRCETGIEVLTVFRDTTANSND